MLLLSASHHRCCCCCCCSVVVAVIAWFLACQELVKVCIQMYIARGGNRRAHINWDHAVKQTLCVVQQKQVIKRRPGFSHMPKWYYEQNHGSLETNGRRVTLCMRL